MGRPRKLETRTRYYSHVTEYGVLRRKIWQVSRLVRSSRIQRCQSFSERVGPRNILLRASQVSSCSKRSREITTEPTVALTKNRQLACIAAVSFPSPNAREREKNCERVGKCAVGEWGEAADGNLSSPPPPPSYSPSPHFSPIFLLTPGVLLRSPAFRSLV